MSFEGIDKDRENRENEREELMELMRENRRTLKEETEKWKKREEEWHAKEREWEERILSLEEKVKTIENEVERWEEMREIENMTREEKEKGYSRTRSRGGGSVYSGISKISGISGISGTSEDRLSEREVNKIKRMLSDGERKERKERKNNVVIKGLEEEPGKEINIERVITFFKDKLDLECKVDACWKSGKVVVVKLRKEEEKLQILKNKSKLKGGKDLYRKRYDVGEEENARENNQMGERRERKGNEGYKYRERQDKN